MIAQQERATAGGEGIYLTVSSISVLFSESGVIRDLNYSKESPRRTLLDFVVLSTDGIVLFRVDGTEVMGERAWA